MFELLVLVSLNCGETKIENLTNTWTNRDQKRLEFNKTRCGIIFQQSPCLKKFIKREQGVYWAICGKES